MTLLIESLSIEIVSKEVVKDEAVFEFKYDLFSISAW